MPSVARVGDIGDGTCKAGHPGFPLGVPKPMTTEFVTGASTVFMDNQPVVIVGSIGATDCGHHTEALTGSPTVFVEGQPMHRVGDVGVVTETGGGDYETITGSPDCDN